MKWTDANEKTHDLVPITEPFVDPVGRRMLCWNGPCVVEQTVYAYIQTVIPGVITRNTRFLFCAPIKKPVKRRMTNRELAKWLAQGNGELNNPAYDNTYYCYGYDPSMAGCSCLKGMKIRAWDETEWREPEVE